MLIIKQNYDVVKVMKNKLLKHFYWFLNSTLILPHHYSHQLISACACLVQIAQVRYVEWVETNNHNQKMRMMESETGVNK